MAGRPTLRNLTDSYESWAYRNGLFRQLSTLQRQRLVERDLSSPDQRLYRLTEQGRLLALGGRDPQAQWARPWDGSWRLVLFDVPTSQNTRRDKLRRYLRSRGFGYLQNSIWITPDPIQSEVDLFAGTRIDVESLLFMEAKGCAGENDTEIVAGAWDFGRINECYRWHMEVLDRYPKILVQDVAAAGVLHRWASEERLAWLKAVTLDPLLPTRLLPTGYLGRQAWQRRMAVLREAGQRLRPIGMQK